MACSVWDDSIVPDEDRGLVDLMTTKANINGVGPINSFNSHQNKIKRMPVISRILTAPGINASSETFVFESEPCQPLGLTSHDEDLHRFTTDHVFQNGDIGGLLTSNMTQVDTPTAAKESQSMKDVCDREGSSRRSTELTVRRQAKIDVEMLRRKAEEEEVTTTSKLLTVAFQWLAIGFLLVAFLTCLVVTKLSFSQLVRDFNETVTQSSSVDLDLDLVAQHESLKNISDEETAVFIFVLTAIMLPYLLTFFRVLWCGWRSDRLWPSWNAVFWGILSSLSECIGVSLFLMQFLCNSSTSSMIISIAATSGILCFPLIVALIKCVKDRTQWNMTSFVLFGFAISLSVAGIACAIYFCYCQHVSDPKETWTDFFNNYLALLLSLALMSFSWCPEVTWKQIHPRKSQLQDLLKNPDDVTLVGDDLNLLNTSLSARWKISVLTNLIKIIVIPVFSILYMNYILCFNQDFRAGFKRVTPYHRSFSWFMANVFCSFGSYVFGWVACMVCLKKPCFALPLGLAAPISFVCVVLLHETEEMSILCIVSAICLVICQALSTFIFAWKSQPIAMQKESEMFWLPGYHSVFVDQWLMLNCKKSALASMQHMHETDAMERARRTRILMCTTMHRETVFEMEQLLESFKMINRAKQESNRDVQAHIFFDNGVREIQLTEFALQLVSIIRRILEVEPENCTKVLTPYGLRLTWELPVLKRRKRGMILTVHLKDSLKVKPKKRWSQVMYMSYVLDYIVKEEEMATDEDVYILTTDADVRFSPESVESLLDLMIRDSRVGAVSARTFPIGTGPVYWYQIFDYAVGHWLQKAAEHVLGSVLCSPGCFSVYRVAAIRDVLPIYCSEVEKGSEFLTKDMGEDRWLCTLLVESGWRLEYCAAASISTCCPTEFDEFFKQRRRWIPSTLANLILLIKEWNIITHSNKQISYLFMIYQSVLLFSTLINPSLCILIIIGGLFYAWNMNQIATLCIMLTISITYTVICCYCSPEFQLKTAKILTYGFALLMGAVVIGTVVQIVDDNFSPKYTSIVFPHKNRTNYTLHSVHGILQNHVMTTPMTSTISRPPDFEAQFHLPFTPSTLYLIVIVSIFIVSALLHPSEAYCLLPGILYLLCLPAGNLILMIYSICNITERSWGTREEKKIEDLTTVNSWMDYFSVIANMWKGDTVEDRKGICGFADMQTDSVEETVENVKRKNNYDKDGSIKINENNQHGLFGRRRRKTSDYQFQGQSLEEDSKIVRDWLPADLCDLYSQAFESNGYEDTSLISGITERELRSIGIDSKGHRAAILNAAKLLPDPAIEPFVPLSVLSWLERIGLQIYYGNFCRSHIMNATSLEILKNMSRKELKNELQIFKQGHLRRLLLGLQKLRYPTKLEVDMSRVKYELEALPLFNLDQINRGEYDFWVDLRKDCLMPDSGFTQELNLRAELEHLRNCCIMFLGLINAMWLLLIMTLLTKTELNYLGTNVLGLMFLIIFGFMIVIQFICMVIHRFSTGAHLVARAPTFIGQPFKTNFSFSDQDFPVDVDFEDSTDLYAHRHKDRINKYEKSKYVNRVRSLLQRKKVPTEYLSDDRENIMYYDYDDDDDYHHIHQSQNTSANSLSVQAPCLV